MKTLIAYFSAQGTTAKLAKELAPMLGADLFEIRPVEPYTDADIKWTNPFARCNREKLGKKDVPVVGEVEDFAAYDTVLIGFPIWYYCAPNIVNTFCKAYDWTGKKVALFATSGSSGVGKTAEKLQPFVKGAEIADAKRVSGIDELKSWAESL